jgi:hypothetical protein
VNLEIHDPFLLGTIQPSNVQSYLRSGGWDLTFVEEGIVSVWTLPAAPESFEVHVPLDVDASGYAQRIHELLEQLSAIEDRSQLRVFLDIQEWNSDAIRFGYTTRPGLEYPILGAGIDLLAQARELLMAVASSIVDPQPWYARRRPKEAAEYVATLEVSPFEEPLNIRVLARLEAALFGAGESEFLPFARRVSVRLRDSLDYLSALLTMNAMVQDSDWLDSCLQYGLSANVTESILSLLQHSTSVGATVEISLRLAAARSLPNATLSVWRFRRAQCAALKEIGDRLKSFTPGADERVLFLVENIRDTRRGRIISGAALIGDEFRRIEMSVDDELLRVAELARSRNSAVQCVGRLRRRPNSARFELLQPHDVQIIHGDNDTVAELRRKMPCPSEGKGQLPLIKQEP